MSIQVHTEHNNTSDKRYFLEIRDNRIAEVTKVPQNEDEGWVKKEVKFGNNNEESVEKWFRYYDSVTGIITNFWWFATEGTPYSGYKIQIEDSESDEKYQLTLKANNKQLMEKFLLVAENIDYSKPVKIVAFPSFPKDKEGKPKLNAEGEQKVETALVFYQDDQVVRRKYNKDNPAEVKPTFNKREKKWNFDEYYTWLYEQVDALGEKLGFGEPDYSSSEVAAEVAAEVNAPDVPDEEIPF